MLRGVVYCLYYAYSLGFAGTIALKAFSMKRLPVVLSFLFALMLTGASVSSCASDDEQVISTSPDCAITSVTLGTLKRTILTKDKQGRDSTYMVNVTGAYYPLNIDQLAGRIFNTDSLPCGTDLSHVVFSAFNLSGNMTIRSLYSGEDTIFLRTDSTDLSRERVVDVRSTDGTAQRSYTLSLCAHQEEADTFRWTRMATGLPQLAAITSPSRLVALGQQLLVYTGSASGVQCIALSKSLPIATTTTAMPEGFAASSVIVRGDELLALINGQVHTSTDGVQWAVLPTSFCPDALLCATPQRVYALMGGAFYSSADGITWVRDEAEAHSTELPAGGIAAAVRPRSGDATFEELVLTGITAAGKACVWRKVIDRTDSENFPWEYLPAVDDAAFVCPALQNATLSQYDNALLLVGNVLDATPQPALRLSRDGGRTWSANEVKLPADLAAEELIGVTDNDQFIWLIAGGDLWRGRINRLGWADVNGSFE